MEIDYKRQTAIFDPELFEEKKVTIIGLGNIGSHVALTLARMGIRSFVLFDHDTVENHNLSSQSYNRTFIGVSKVEAVSAQIRNIDATIRIEGNPTKFENGHVLNSDLVVVGVDSLKARREIAEQLTRTDYRGNIIDARIGGEQLEIYICQNPEEFKKAIPEGDAVPDICGGEFIAYVSVIVGGLVACQVKKILTGQPTDKSIMVNVPSLQVAKDFEW